MIVDPPTQPIALPVPYPAPVAPARRSGLGLGLLAGVLVALLAVGGLALVRPDVLGLPSSPLFAAGEPAPGSSTGASPDPASGGAAVAPAATAGATGEQGLRDAVDGDRADVEATVGSWVPQLASKRDGTVDDGRRYGLDDVLDEYHALRTRFGDARLLSSDDWPVFRGGGYWVTIAAQPFPTAAAANAWCDAQGLSGDHCFAKRLSHDGGPAGTTVPR